MAENKKAEPIVPKEERKSPEEYAEKTKKILQALIAKVDPETVAKNFDISLEYVYGVMRANRNLLGNEIPSDDLNIPEQETVQGYIEPYEAIDEFTNELKRMGVVDRRVDTVAQYMKYRYRLESLRKPGHNDERGEKMGEFNDIRDMMREAVKMKMQLMLFQDTFKSDGSNSNGTSLEKLIDRIENLEKKKHEDGIREEIKILREDMKNKDSNPQLEKTIEKLERKIDDTSKDTRFKELSLLLEAIKGNKPDVTVKDFLEVYAQRDKMTETLRADIEKTRTELMQNIIQNQLKSLEEKVSTGGRTQISDIKEGIKELKEISGILGEGKEKTGGEVAEGIVKAVGEVLKDPLNKYVEYKFSQPQGSETPQPTEAVGITKTEYEEILKKREAAKTVQYQQPAPSTEIPEG